MIDRETLCDLEAEQALCGIALTDNAAADEALAVLRPEAFYRDAHRRIWQAVSTLRGRRSGCDVLTVADALQAAGSEQVVPPTYLPELAQAAPSPAMAMQYAEMVREAHARREVVRAAKAAIAMAQDPKRDMRDVMVAANEGLRGAAEAAAAGDGPVSLPDLLTSAYQEIDDIYEGKIEPGIATGIPVLDRALAGGLRRAEVTILGGRPSVGKSSLAQQIATAIAFRGERVAFASAEMSGRMVALRSLSADAGIDSKRFRGRKDSLSPHMTADDWPLLSRSLGRLSDRTRTLFVDARSRAMDDIAAQTRRLHAREPLSLLVVDHLQHLRTPGGSENRTQAVGRMAGECKDLAVSLNIAVLVLSQLRRLAPGEDRKPRLSDLRESGDIEQVADVVLLLHRPGGEVPPPLCEVECAVAKHRNGELEGLSLWHERATGRWFDASNRPGLRMARPVAGDAS